MCGSVSALIADSAYMCQEVDRFHALLKTAGDKWGGGKEMSEQVCSKSYYLKLNIALECLPRFISCYVRQSARPSLSILSILLAGLMLTPVSNKP